MVYWGVWAIHLNTGPPFLIDPSHSLMGCDLMKVYPANTGGYLKGPTGHLELFSVEYDYKAYRRYHLKVLIPSPKSVLPAR